MDMDMDMDIDMDLCIQCLTGDKKWDATEIPILLGIMLFWNPLLLLNAGDNSKS